MDNSSHSFPQTIWRHVKEFSAFGGDATFLWPRWLLLRAIGLVYVVIFSGILADSQALIGPQGITPVADFCALLTKLFPSALERFIRAPSLFWISTNAGMIDALGWAGMGAAIGLVLNLWPRAALLVCWASLLSFVSTWQIFSPTIIDQLMIEAALLAVFFAPSGFRPGLGAASPPRAVAVFMMRWFLFRIMFSSGLIKVFAGDSHWRDFTALDVMYETNPSPTILGYFDAHLPHAYHVFEILLTLTAEIVAPIVAVMGGRRGRWFALVCWTILQTGIQLTGNFGWLNTAAIALGLLLLDDQMIAQLLRKLRLGHEAERMLLAASPISHAGWGAQVGAAFLWGQFALTVYFSVVLCAGKSVVGAPEFRQRPIDFLFRDFRSANAYIPFAAFPPAKYEVEFTGSNDGGVTWRPYLFRSKPQREDRIGRFVAPRFARFDSAIQLALFTNSPVLTEVAKRLLTRSPAVMRLFENDPFPEKPPTIVRLPVYQFSFTDLETRRKTGRYWSKAYVSDCANPFSLADLNPAK